MFYQYFVIGFIVLGMICLSTLNILLIERRISYNTSTYVGYSTVVMLVAAVVWLFAIICTKEKQIEYKPYNDTYQIKITTTVPNYYCGVWCDEVTVSLEAK